MKQKSLKTSLKTSERIDQYQIIDERSSFRLSKTDASLEKIAPFRVESLVSLNPIQVKLFVNRESGPAKGAQH